MDFRHRHSKGLPLLQTSRVRLFHQGGPLIDCLGARGAYTFTIGIYAEDFRSTEQTVRIRVGEDAEDIEFFPRQCRLAAESPIQVSETVASL